MKLRTIDAATAAEYRGMIPPHVLARPDMGQLVWFAALEEGRLIALASCDPLPERSELVSVAVDPEYQRMGVGKALLSYAAGCLWEAGAEALGCVYPAEEDGLSPLLASCGFQREEDPVRIFLSTLGEVEHTPLLQKIVGQTPIHGIKALSALTNLELRTFSAEMVEKGLHVPIRREDFDPELSQLYLEGREIKAAFFLRVLSLTQVENSWTYLAPGTEPSGALLHLFAQAVRLGAERFPPETRISFACLNAAGEKLLRHILPDSAQTGILYRYVLTPRSQAESGEAIHPPEASAPLVQEPDRVFPELGLEPANDEDLYCARCIHRTERLTSCDKYRRKPGAVLYGGPCKFFAE